ncbi:unnamed protein product [Prorocentrum cordatum]|uniref:Uncharacterized protein n=1 Tax=Prorocentrum cordatum TaxID=2364126 RepID=A0ABN9WG78_9DINO|nr:unnamed protein product [Polarella glacialis]
MQYNIQLLAAHPAAVRRVDVIAGMLYRALPSSLGGTISGRSQRLAVIVVLPSGDFLEAFGRPDVCLYAPRRAITGSAALTSTRKLPASDGAWAPSFPTQRVATQQKPAGKAAARALRRSLAPSALRPSLSQVRL